MMIANFVVIVKVINYLNSFVVNSTYNYYYLIDFVFIIAIELFFNYQKYLDYFKYHIMFAHIFMNDLIKSYFEGY